MCPEGAVCVCVLKEQAYQGLHPFLIQILKSDGQWVVKDLKNMHLYVGLVSRKPVFRVSDQVKPKPSAQLQRLAGIVKFPLQ